MADNVSPEKRSYIMSRIRGKNTKPELLVRKFLFSKGYRYRIHCKKLPGRPDIVLRKFNTVIQVHGCFWHGHENCKHFKLPKSRTEWWSNKINRNKQIDIDTNETLQNLGWKVIVIYECELKKNTAGLTLNEILLRL